MNGRNKPSNPQPAILPPLMKFDDTADFILSPSKAKRLFDPAAKVNGQPQPLILPKLQPVPIAVPVVEEVPISKELAAKLKTDRRTTEEIRRSKLTYMLQMKYIVLLSLSEAQEKLIAKRAQLARLLKRRNEDPYLSAKNLQAQEGFKQEILTARAEVASLTTEYDDLSANPELQKFEKDTSAKELAIRGLQKRFVEMGLPYSLKVSPVKERPQCKKLSPDKIPLSVMNEERQKKTSALASDQRPKWRSVYDKFAKPVNMPKVRNAEPNIAAPVVKPGKFKQPQALVVQPYFPVIVPKQGHGQREPVVTRQEYTPPGSRFMENKPKSLADERRAACFFAITPPLSPLKQPKKVMAVITPAIVLSKVRLVSRKPKLILGNGARGSACFFGVRSPLLSPVKSPLLPVLQLGEVERSADDIQVRRDKKSPR
jgi:hypothetical protein